MCQSAFVTRPLPPPLRPAPPAIRPPAFLPHSPLLAEPFLLHVWHVPCVCRLSCSLPAPFQDMTKEREGWLLLHLLLLLMSAGTKTAGPANASGRAEALQKEMEFQVLVSGGPSELSNLKTQGTSLSLSHPKQERRARVPHKS